MGSERVATRVFREIDRRAGLARRSPLFHWLRDNYEGMAARVANAGGSRLMNWSAVAEVLGEAGLLDADGQKPSGQVVRKTWRKVVALTGQRPEKVQ